MGTVVVARSRGGKRKSAPAAIAFSRKDEAMIQQLRQIIWGGYQQSLHALKFG
tara:strand:+ start:640 stop:798 length:159 start_codon:yes stop_codon:yes gene_type:complete